MHLNFLVLWRRRDPSSVTRSHRIIEHSVIDWSGSCVALSLSFTFSRTCTYFLGRPGGGLKLWGVWLIVCLNFVWCVVVSNFYVYRNGCYYSVCGILRLSLIVCGLEWIEIPVYHTWFLTINYIGDNVKFKCGDAGLNLKKIKKKWKGPKFKFLTKQWKMIENLGIVFQKLVYIWDNKK